MRRETMRTPFSTNAFEPHWSADVVDGFCKRRRRRLDRLHRLVDGTSYEPLSLSAIVCRAHRRSDDAVFETASGALQDELFCGSVSPNGGGQPPEPLRAALQRQFGSDSRFVGAFCSVADASLDPHWVWLALDGRRLRVMPADVSGCPLVRGVRPLLVLDVSENAYVNDYGQDRSGYVEAFLKHLVNWDTATRRFADSFFQHRGSLGLRRLAAVS